MIRQRFPLTGIPRRFRLARNSLPQLACHGCAESNWRQFFRALIFAAITTSALAGCASSASPTHVALQKAGATQAEATSDLAICRFEADKAAGPLALDPMAAAQRRGYWNRILASCLESRGYTLIQRPGVCTGACRDGFSLPN